jgi:Cu-Zn family superoxide dismutase
VRKKILAFVFAAALLVALAAVALVVGDNDVRAGDGAEQAVARVQGGPLAPSLSGTVVFRQTPDGVIVSVEVTGLPPYTAGTPPIGPHGFHIHAVGNCTVGDPTNPFLGAGGHFNPTTQVHGDHAGDLPVLFSNDGRAEMTVLTDAFDVSDVNGRAVIIHKNPDDYRTDPTGAAGLRLACGVIESKRAND